MKEEIETAPDRPEPRWTGTEILGVVLLAVLCQAAARPLLESVGWFRWYYGGSDVSTQRESLWTTVVTGVMQIVVTLVWFRFGLGVTLEELGLTSVRWRKGVVAGLLFALIFAPGAYAIQWLALQAMEALGVQEQPHVFTQLGTQSLFPAEWTLLIAAAVVMAPIWEELVFRGILQPWVIGRQPWGGPTALAVALALTCVVRADHLRAGLETGVNELGIELIPFAALAAAAAAYPLVNQRSAAAGGLYATAVLFAWIHVSVWPTPIPLLWLALGLGWLRWKTGGLVASIVLHAAFNAIAVVALLRLKLS